MHEVKDQLRDHEKRIIALEKSDVGCYWIEVIEKLIVSQVDKSPRR